MLRRAPTLLFGVALIIISNLIALVPPLILQNVIDGLGRHADVGSLTGAALLIVGIALGAGAFQFSSRFVINSVSRTIEYEMRRDLFRHFQRLDLAYFQQRKIGDPVARATNDLSQVRQMLGPGVSNLTNATVALAVTAAAMI
jgi:ATP-binding cassette, subfamily B, multidrug efflux pump